MKKNKARDLILLYINCTDIVTRILWFWNKERQSDEWNRRESSEIHPHAVGHLICNKGDNSGIMKNTEPEETGVRRTGKKSITEPRD